MTAADPTPDLGLARRLVARQFPEWAHLPVTEVELSGWDNRTFRLGDELTIRLPRSRSYAEQVAKEQRWLPVLGPRLPVPIPRPVAQGRPGLGYLHTWSVYAWIDGRPATPDRIEDQIALARAVATFLVALRACPADGGPLPGQHNWWRGGPLDHYLDEARAALAVLADEVDVPAATAILDTAVASTWSGPPVWFHGDIAFGNLLVRDGRLAAVIDFGTSGIGDPACDVVLAWTLLSGPGRAAFHDALGLDHDTWARGRGWGLWKALITVAGSRDTDVAAADDARRVLREILDHPVSAPPQSACDAAEAN
ncbi:aminoglycoside phosphotransferase family protein [Microlunatus aurantiacus]|uniref:Aminoglycoside phosphotransferase family protein n=1 Tax=Microlunatus aurantiacus TaxID=446786 RepID=A0ABP7DWU1_9ACTN